MTKNGGTTIVTLVATEDNNAIFAERQPTVTVECSYARAVVTDPSGARIESTLSGGKISFTVTTGGEYTITRIGTSAPSSKPAEDGKTDEPQPDDGSGKSKTGTAGVRKTKAEKESSGGKTGGLLLIAAR